MITEDQKKIIKQLEDRLPYIFAPGGIEWKVQEVGNGVVNISLKVYNGFVTDVVYTEVATRKSFKKKLDTKT